MEQRLDGPAKAHHQKKSADRRKPLRSRFPFPSESSEHVVDVLPDVLDHRPKGIRVGFRHEIKGTSQKVLAAIGNEELEVGSHVPFDQVLGPVDLVAVVADALRFDVPCLDLMLIG